MSPPISLVVPAVLRAGDTATWRRVLPDYPAHEGWDLDYILVHANRQITFAATADGANHLIDVAATITYAWPPGTYAWQERATKDGRIHTTATGTLTLLPSFAAATLGLDARTHAQKTLEALEAWIESRDLGVAEYQIGGRQLRTIPVTELLLLRDRYRREVRESTGQPKSGRVMVRFR